MPAFPKGESQVGKGYYIRANLLEVAQMQGTRGWDTVAATRASDDDIPHWQVQEIIAIRTKLRFCDLAH